jgi:hypothetical protein
MQVPSNRRAAAWLHSSLSTTVALLFATGLGAQAQTITNPSFEADVFTTAPGSISANGPITGWTVADPARAGLAPAGALNAFANNGTVPDGTNVLYLQTTNVASTVLSGLTPGLDYTVRFRVNSTAGTTPTLRVAIDNNPSLFDAGSVASVAAAGAAYPYKHVAFNFTATAASHTLNITNNATAITATLLLDAFRINVSTSGWSYAQWSNDATSGVDSSKRYTHAFAFNTSGASFTINSVPFTRLGGANPTLRYEFAGALGSATTDGANVLRTAGGGSGTLASQFAYGGNPAVFAFHNLIPGREYVATWYTVGWDAAGKTYGRSVTFAAGDDMISINQDHFGDNQGTRISYRYTAPASGFIVVSNIPFSTAIGTLHTYGASNYEVTSTNEPSIGVQPASKESLPESGAGFYVTAGGASPLGYQWLKDGGVMANQTNRVLLLTNLTGADLASYSVVVANAFGVVTSSTAGLTFTTATFANPSFEGDVYMTWPGYAGDNFPIPGWYASSAARVGLSMPGGGSPFVNNGAQAGQNAAFLQNAGGGSNGLSTVIQNLTPGILYTLNFAVNARAGQTPNLHVAVDGQSISDIRVSSVGAAGFGGAGGANPFRRVAFDFTPANSSVFLSLTNDQTGDTTILLDDFSIAPSTTKWSHAAWTNDASSGVDGSKFYTHALNFGTVSNTVINGVTFLGVAGANPTIPGYFISAGFGNVFANDANLLTVNADGSSTLARDFLYGGPVQTITLTNLVPGIEYVATIFGVGFDPRAYGRSATFSVGNDRQTINLDHFGNDVGNRVSYQYTADASGAITFTCAPTDVNSTFHTYGFANYQLVGTQPVIAAQPASIFAPIDELVTLSVSLSAGAQPTFFQWQLDGVDLLDQTNSALVLSNLTVGAIGNYRVIVTNSFGSTTSQVAVVEWGYRIGEIFNTGVDENRLFYSGGQIDPHYKLVFSPDPFFPGPDALVMHNGAFPLLANYFTNGLFSSWISPRTNSSPGNSNGFYVYRTSFVIDTTDATHARINGKWASDNEGIGILINGVPTGISNMVSAAFTAFTPFTITNGFVPGSNIVDFVISNGPATGPTGLRVEMSGVGRPLTNTPPQIVAQPASRTVGELSDVSFTVQAIGSGPLLYQWYQDGIDLPGQTNRTMVLTDVSQIDQSGSYYVTVSNEFGSTNSATAQLTIIIPPSIDALDGQTQTLECGGTSFMAVYALGEEPLVYQWYFGNTPVLGATNYDFYITNVTALNAGLYKVVITNGGGSITSAPLSLTVQDTVAPVIVTCATNMSVTANASCQAIVPNLLSQIVAADCNSLSVTQSPAPGTVLSLGTHTITFTITDAANNVTNCQSTFTVGAAVPNVPLFIQAEGTNAVITWPTTAATCWQLYQTGDLTPPRTWSLVTNTVSTVGTNFSVTVSSTLTNRFFRLQGP